MWITKIFAREFGFSDVQSNYSRVYSWMANQLGHMTLGLTTVFFFVWIADTVASTAELAINWSARSRAETGDCELALACAANNYLLFFATGVIALAILAIIWLGLFGEAEPLLPGEAKGYAPIGARARRTLHGVYLAIILLAFWQLLSAAARATTPEEAAWFLHLTGVAAACFAVGAGVLLLCRDRRFFAFALIALFGAFWIATDGAGADPAVRRWSAAALAGLFFLYAMHATVTGRGVPEKMPGLERWLQGLTIAALAAWFVSGTWNGLEGDWPLAIAAAIASGSLWWIKEFGSDLPNVHREIALAAARRPSGLLGLCRLCEKDYLDDARMDARTDGLFYFAGAWISAGVVSDTPVFTAASWESGSELLGLIVFLIIFLSVGKNWAFRQQALDFCAVDSASRLAVFRSAFRMVVIPPDQELLMERAVETDADAAPARDYIDEPVDILREFAHGRWDPEHDAIRFDHLIVFGAVGSGRSPLGRALASEAALADLPTLAERLPFGAGPTRRRTARFVRAARLPDILRDVTRREDITATPTVDLLAPEDDRPVRRRASRDEPAPERCTLESAASLVVIDDMSLASGATPRRLIETLDIAGGQQTVWLVDDARFEDMAGDLTKGTVDDWTPDYRDVEDELAAMRAALTLEGAAPPRIAVGFTRRYQPSTDVEEHAPPTRP